MKDGKGTVYDIEMQLTSSKELPKGTMDDVSPELKAFLDYVAGKKPADPFVDELEEAVKNARKNREWRHEYMTLLMRDQENKEIGREEGLEIGISGMVSSLRDFNIPDIDILLKIQEKYNLSQEEAERYMEISAIQRPDS